MRTLPLSLLLLPLLAGTAPNATAEDPPSYDARLSGYDYPFPVRFLDLDLQRQELEMAFMDVRAERPNGRTVLLLHGKNFSGAYWGRTIEALTAAGYRVVAPDQIGFGKSSKPARFQFSFQALATHTRRLLDDLGIRRVTVVGHSMGGMLATRFALMFPDRTRQLVLVNPIGLEDWKRVVPYPTIEEWFRLELKKTPDRIKTYMRESYFDGDWKPAYQELVEIQAGWARGPDHERIAWVSALTDDMVFTQPVVYELDDLEPPTLLLIGQKDRTALGKERVPQEVAKRLGNYPRLGKRAAGRIPNSTLVELEGVGHVPQFEAWDKYIGALKGFLEDTD